jgi:hypothetical protein
MIEQPTYEAFAVQQLAAGIYERLQVLEGSPAFRGLMLPMPSPESEQLIRAAATAALLVLRRDMDSVPLNPIGDSL